MKSKTSFTLPASYMEEHFNSVMNYLSFGVVCPYEMRNQKVMNGKLPFVKKTLEYSAKHPELIPGYENLPNHSKDKSTLKNLKMFASDAGETLEKISKKNGAVDYVAYAYALAFYENAHNASTHKINAATRIYKELQKELPAPKRKAA